LVEAESSPRVNRRSFALAVTLGLLAVPARGDTQAARKIPKIGVLSPFSLSESERWHEALKEGLRDLGWLEGKTIAIEYRYADGDNQRLPRLVDELIRLNVNMLVTSVVTDTIVALKATRTIPIVMASAGDPVSAGLATSLARPGGNVTGLTQMAVELIGKRLALLKEIVPSLSRVAVLWHRHSPSPTDWWKESQGPARDLKLLLQSLPIQNASDLDKAFDEATKARAGALVISPSPLFVTNFKRLADLGLKHRLPSMFHIREFADAGGLIAYGPDRAYAFRRAAMYVDKILKGAKPGDLPIEQPTKFELVINLKTAERLGLTIPPRVLVTADAVIR
jgi:putative ABC transport system substrate-binding protein